MNLISVIYFFLNVVLIISLYEFKDCLDETKVSSVADESVDGTTFSYTFLLSFECFKFFFSWKYCRVKQFVAYLIGVWCIRDFERRVVLQNYYLKCQYFSCVFLTDSALVHVCTSPPICFFDGDNILHLVFCRDRTLIRQMLGRSVGVLFEPKSLEHLWLVLHDCMAFFSSIKTT